MTVLERKAILIKEILDVQDENVFEMIELYVHELHRNTMDKEPCLYSVEELKARLREGEKEIEAGGGISHEQILAEYGL